MSWYAIDAVSDGIDETRALLLPFDLTRWLTLAVMAFFVGGGTGNVPTTGVQGDVPVDVGAVPHVPAGVLVAAAAGVLLVLVSFGFVGAVLQFVFVDALRTRDVHVRGRFRDRFGKGVRLFGFQVVLFAVVAVTVAGLLAPVVLVFGGGSPAVLALWLIGIPVALLVFLGVGVAWVFTTSFVVPVVCERGGTILGAWRSLWPELVAEWQQFLLFVVVKFGLGMAAGFAMGIGMTVVFLPVFVLVGAGLLAGHVAPVLVGVAAVLAVVLYLVVLVAVQTPVTVFLRYHALCTLDASEVEWSLRESVEERVE